MLTYRKDLTRPLTAVEVDENFTFLNSSVDAISAKADADFLSLSLYSGSNGHAVIVVPDTSLGSLISLDLCSIPIDLAHNYSISFMIDSVCFAIGSYVPTSPRYRSTVTVNAGAVTLPADSSGYSLTFDAVTNTLKVKKSALDITLFS